MQATFSLGMYWVLLYGLLLQLWNKVLTTVGNELAIFLYVEEDCLFGRDKRMAQILVELDVHAGLLEEIEIVWQGRVFFQPLDY